MLTGIDSRHLLDVSFKALALGALMVVAKPEGMPDRDPEAQNLILQVKTMAGVKVVRRPLWLQPQTEPGRQQPAKCILPPKPTLHREAPKLIAIGISTGGPPALQMLLSGLPPTFPVPIVVVQHISRGFVSGLANWLSETTPLSCKVTSQSEILQPGQVYLAPDDRHLIIKPSGLVWLDASEPIGNHRPSVTVLFQSVARNYGPAAIGVLMTGMGEDGARGLLAMRQAGAYTLAQDEASSIIFGMPKAAIDLGASEEVLALDQMAYRLLALAGGYR